LLFTLRDLKLRARNFASDVFAKFRKALPVWGFPMLFILLGLIFLIVQIAISDKGPPKVEHTWKPEWNATVRDESPKPSKDDLLAAAAPSSAPAVAQPAPVQGSSVASESTPSLSNGTEVPGPDAIFVFKDYGRAHGVGLCMDGVRYRAVAGQSSLQIINAYYTGVTVQQTDDSRPIRVKGHDGAIHTLPMKEYLYHLAEEPEDYPPEGLKVLYMAARAYTLSVIARGKHAAQGFDICSSGDCCQAFDENKNLAANPNNVHAVDVTAGQALFYGDQPIIAAYCGSCGGHTENNEDVWGAPAIPYLRGKPDSYCSQSPRFCTTKEISARELSSRLGVSDLRLIDLSSRTPGGRVKTARIVGAGGTKNMSGKALGDIFGFRTTRYEYSFR
jgi:SpoIID/LytB domain protein